MTTYHLGICKVHNYSTGTGIQYLRQSVPKLLRPFMLQVEFATDCLYRKYIMLEGCYYTIASRNCHDLLDTTDVMV
jgi:hypothetical protein